MLLRSAKPEKEIHAWSRSWNDDREKLNKKLPWSCGNNSQRRHPAIENLFAIVGVPIQMPTFLEPKKYTFPLWVVDVDIGLHRRRLGVFTLEFFSLLVSFSDEARCVHSQDRAPASGGRFGTRNGRLIPVSILSTSPAWRTHTRIRTAGN